MYEIYAMKVSERLTDSAKVMLNTDPGKMIMMFFYFYVLKSKDQIILVDTGISKEEMDARKISGPTREELLSRINVRAADVENIILSHLHGDHFAQPEIQSQWIVLVVLLDLRDFRWQHKNPFEYLNLQTTLLQ